jgi:putative transcriptional regulator
MTTHYESLRNRFLVASPYLQASGFQGSVIFLCEHNEEGALGLVVNRALDLTVGDVLAQLDMDGEELSTPVCLGGPVQPERGFVLHRPVGQWQQSLAVTDQLAMTTSRDVLAAIGSGEGPQDFLMALGYSGWGEGQLEEELAGNSWLVCPADDDLLFRTPVESRYAAALRAMGVDLNQLSGSVGHA